jgi:hypothetical protein
MAAATLFAYSVEDDDGKLVIKVGGAFAEKALHNLNEGLTKGTNFPIAAFLSPLKPLRRLFSAQVALQAGKGFVVGGESTTMQEDTEGSLNQSVDETLAGFKEQMAEFRKSLEAFGAEIKSSASQATKTPKV